ncbi:MAG: type II toxin-antitoxin system VapC family toxin [Armatimonadota bacterium]
MLLLDTCTMLWLADDQSRLSTAAREWLARQKDALYFSPISAWEITWKHRSGKLSLPIAPAEWLTRAIQIHGLIEAPITREIVVASALLPDHHRDPCDRILVATAQERRFRLLTPDERIHQYPEANACW